MSKIKIFGMINDNYYIFLHCLLVVAFSALSDQILNSLIEISQFFMKFSSASLNRKGLRDLKDNIPLILYKLKGIFYLTFFDSMDHLLIHLPYKAEWEYMSRIARCTF